MNSNGSQTLLTAATLALVAMAAVPVRADGLISSLPEDGAFCRFRLTTRVEAGRSGTDFSGSLTVASVGKTSEDGEACRWIEIKSAFTQGGREGTSIIKLLIPEEHLGTGKKPLDHVVRGWIKNLDEEPLRYAAEHRGLIQVFFLPGALRDAGKHAEKRTVTLDEEQLVIEEAMTGKHANIPQGAPGMEADATYFIWRHEKAPFGVAAVRQEIELKRNEAVMARHRIELEIVATGTGAESELPQYD
jgi:hypothetical protein